MILSRDLKVKISQTNFSYYENLGYDVTLGDEIMVPIELLSKGSNVKLRCKCDKCGIIKEVIYKNYLKYNVGWGEYYCRKCTEPKRKETLKMNYGVEYPIQNNLIKEKIKNTMVEKYGVDNYGRLRKK